MKKIANVLLLVFALIVFSSSVYVVYIDTQEKTYCQGFKIGYKNGWCYNDPACIEPIIPLCGIPRVGFDTYKDGKEYGFIAGRKKRKAEKTLN